MKYLLFVALLCAGCQIDTELEADSTSQNLSRRVIATPVPPEVTGPFSRAIQVRNMLLVTGQIGVNPVTRILVEGGMGEETRQAMNNLKAVLVAAGFTMADDVQAQVFLAEMSDYAAMNEINGSFFENSPPGRAAYSWRGCLSTLAQRS